jgi:lipopolysaccharide export system permease protein
MRHRWLRPLDKYVLTEFLKILAATTLGFPVLVIVIDITENLDKYLQRHLQTWDIVQAYAYSVPDTMFVVLPASVLFATVFAIGGFTRHSELTAAKASGISFHRFIAPIFFGAVIATALGLVLSAAAPPANARKFELLQERKFRNDVNRFNFAFAGEEGRVYQITAADVLKRTLEGVEIDRKGLGPDYPTYVITARSAKYSTRRGWLLRNGVAHVMTGDSTNFAIAFDSLRDRHFREEPVHLMANPKAPEEMGYGDLGNFIKAMERSGSDVNKLRTERMLKIAIPFTCIIIMMFGAPLATSNQRGGAAYGAGVSLGTTVVFLMLVQLTQAIGDKGIMLPELAAWLPGILFGVVGAVLLVRVRT